MKKELGDWTRRLSLCFLFSSSAGGFSKSISFWRTWSPKISFTKFKINFFFFKFPFTKNITLKLSTYYYIHSTWNYEKTKQNMIIFSDAKELRNREEVVGSGKLWKAKRKKKWRCGRRRIEVTDHVGRGFLERTRETLVFTAAADRRGLRREE